MDKLIEYFEKKEPRYPNQYKELIGKLSRKKDVSISTGTDEEQLERGKVFGSFYECYMYALTIGLRTNHKIQFDRTNGTKFLIINQWKPEDIRRYFFMSLLALSEDNLEAYENLKDDEANEKANQLIDMMEQYAYGGFDIINSKMKDDPEYFFNRLNVVTFLKELEIKNSSY